MNCSASSDMTTRRVDRVMSQRSLAAAHASSVVGLIVSMLAVLSPGEVFGEVFGSDF